MDEGIVKARVDVRDAKNILTRSHVSGTELVWGGWRFFGKSHFSPVNHVFYGVKRRILGC